MEKLPLVEKKPITMLDYFKQFPVNSELVNASIRYDDSSTEEAIRCRLLIGNYPVKPASVMRHRFFFKNALTAIYEDLYALLTSSGNNEEEKPSDADIELVQRLLEDVKEIDTELSVQSDYFPQK